MDTYNNIFEKKEEPEVPLFHAFLIILLVFGVIFIISYVFFGNQNAGVFKADYASKESVYGENSLNYQHFEEEIKSGNRLISILIVGIDARKPVKAGDYLSSADGGITGVNTDTLVEAVFDTQSKKVTLINIPRDLGIEYTDECLKRNENFHSRRSVNHIYKLAVMGNCSEGPVKMLKKYIGKITGIEPQYHFVISFESFFDVINIIGDEHNGSKGLWIDIPQNVYSFYPDEDLGWIPANFTQGRRFLNSRELFIYSRIRANSNDFDRNRRQQQIIEAAIQKLTNESTFKDPSKIFSIMTFIDQKTIFSQLNLGEITNLLTHVTAINNIRVNKIVLDNNLGGQNNILQLPRYTNVRGHIESRYYLIPAVWNNPEYKDDKFLEVKRYISNNIFSQ